MHSTIETAIDHPVKMPDEVEMLDADATCQLIGGSRPIHRASLYRGVKDGRFPAPVKIGPVTSRWIKSEIVAALKAMSAERDEAAA